MTVWKNQDYSKIDLEEINNVLFYPRRDTVQAAVNQSFRTVLIPLGASDLVSSLWSETEKSTATILFFHGNGELASEYIDIAGLFQKMAIRFICVDYRGYGCSSGNPSASSMIEDAHEIFRYVFSRLKKKDELFVIMGRSLGSASALEIAAAYGDQIDGLIIESGFAETLPLLKTIGVDPDYLKLREEDGFANQEKVKFFSKPLLIIHAENDFLIPVDQADKLFAAANSKAKKILKIPNAGHNDIFYMGIKDYMTAINEFMKTAAEWKTAD